jgi:hypothetical protein
VKRGAVLKNYSVITVIGLIVLVLMACNFTNLFATSTAEVVQEPLPTAPVAPTQIGTPMNPQESPDSSADPQSIALACLNGTWQISNLSSYVIAALPPDLAEEYNVEYKETSGSATLTLTPDGRISMQFNQLIFLFDATVSFFTVPLTVAIDGEVRGAYSVQGDVLTTSQMDTSGLTAVAQAVGQDVVPPDQVISLIPLVQPPFNTAIYTCAGDTLQLKFPALAEDFPPLVFQRVK